MDQLCNKLISESRDHTDIAGSFIHTVRRLPNGKKNTPNFFNYLKNVCFEDVMSQFNCLLSVSFPSWRENQKASNVWPLLQRERLILGNLMLQLSCGWRTVHIEPYLSETLSCSPSGRAPPGQVMVLKGSELFLVLYPNHMCEYHKMSLLVGLPFPHADGIKGSIFIFCLCQLLLFHPCFKCQCCFLRILFWSQSVLRISSSILRAFAIT